MVIKNNMTDESRELLIAEYEYVATTANQANEDRARVSSFYIISTGSLVVALLGSQLIENNNYFQSISLTISGLFVTLTLLGSLTIAQLARLRGAWFESMLAMNQIKEYVIKNEPKIEKAFRWKSNTAPKMYKINSISFQQTLEVSVLSALIFGAAIYFFLKGLSCWNANSSWLYLLISSPGMFFIQVGIYKQLISNEEKKIFSNKRNYSGITKI